MMHRHYLAAVLVVASLQLTSVGSLHAAEPTDGSTATKKDDRPWYKRVLGIDKDDADKSSKKDVAKPAEKASDTSTESTEKAEDAPPAAEPTTQAADKPAGGSATPTVASGELAPVYVRMLFAGVGAGHNDSSPRWSSDSALIAVERSEAGKREIVISKPDGTAVKTVYYRASSGDDLGLDLLLPGVAGSISYNSGLAWSADGKRFVFMSNAGEGNYDLYLDTLSTPQTVRITKDPRKDGQPDWSVKVNKIVFVSGRSGGAQLYVYDPTNKKMRRVTRGTKTYLYPRWSPDGRRIAAIYGSNENHDIVIINAPGPGVSTAPHQKLTTWTYDDLSPSWSPDGKKIAFYTNYNKDKDPKRWALVVVNVDATVSAKGLNMSTFVVAENVIPDVAMGPAWLPDSRRIAYVRNNKQDYSPIYVVDINSKESTRLKTGTNINHDVSVSSTGVIAFRAQVEQWDQIFLTKIK